MKKLIKILKEGDFFLENVTKNSYSSKYALSSTEEILKIFYKNTFGTNFKYLFEF